MPNVLLITIHFFKFFNEHLMNILLFNILFFVLYFIPSCIVLPTFSHSYICIYTTVKLCIFTLDNDDVQLSKRCIPIANFYL